MKVKTRSVCLVLSAAIATSLVVPVPAISQVSFSQTQIAQAQTPVERKRVAVLDFDFASTGGTDFYYGWQGIGPAKGVSDLLTSTLR